MLESATSFPPALAGGPRGNEPLWAWKFRLQSRLADQKRAGQERAEQSRAEEHAIGAGRNQCRSRWTQFLVGEGRCGARVSGADKLRELDRLVVMAKALDEVAITDLAADVVECCSLARRLALPMTDGLAAGTTSTTENSVGGRGWNLGIGTMPDGTSEEALMEWFTEEVANHEANTTASRGTPAEQVGRKEIGASAFRGTQSCTSWEAAREQHLKKLLMAVGQDRLQGTNTTEEAFWPRDPGSDFDPGLQRLCLLPSETAPSRLSGRATQVQTLIQACNDCVSYPRRLHPPDKSLVEYPAVPAPSHDGGLDRDAEFATLKAKLEALELADERRQAKLEALEVAEERRQAAFEELQSDNKQLLAEVFAQEQEIKTKEDFWQEAQKTDVYIPIRLRCLLQ
ncbi:unnamed protein product [Ectocarpus sp. CCAP 1310/34]|nr:unnamed protein product [Ectocarpus sp. CCAP 1310/34]